MIQALGGGLVHEEAGIRQDLASPTISLMVYASSLFLNPTFFFFFCRTHPSGIHESSKLEDGAYNPVAGFSYQFHVSFP